MESQIFEILEKYWLGFINLLPNIFFALLIFFIMIFIAKRIKKSIFKRTEKRLHDKLLARFLSNTSKWGVIIIGITLSLKVLGLGGLASSIAAGAGLSGIVFGFAFKDIGENFLSSILLAFNRPFSIGDTVETNSINGIIKSLDLRNTHIRSFDGKDIYIPNSMILKNPLKNYTRDGLLRYGFMVGIDYQNDIKKAKLYILNEIKKIEGVIDDPVPIIYVDEFGTSTINLKILYWVNLFEYKGSIFDLKTEIMEKVKNVLTQNGFSLPAEIIELKIYDETMPIPLRVEKNKTM